MKTIALGRCKQHRMTRKGDVPCFHNFGGDYEVLRELPWGSVVLRHIPSGNIDLAIYDELIASSLPGPWVPIQVVN